MRRIRIAVAAFPFAGLSVAWSQQTASPLYPNYPSETPAKLQPATDSFDYTRREAMIPMRDGVRLHTVILVPKGAKHAPILLTRTPYSADELTTHSASAHLGPTLYGYDNATDVIVEGGYIRVIQDIRGKYGSEGDYVMNRPIHGPQNPTPVDEATDTYDTIDWLIQNIPETNGKVGILGISYDGFLPLMALVHPHPALKVAVPMNPMVDGWMGDDWFHNGAFREQNMPYIYEQEGTRDNNAKQMVDRALRRLRRIHERRLGRRTRPPARPRADGLLAQDSRAPRLRRVLVRPGHGQGAGRRLQAAKASRCRSLLVHSLWDQEDIYGAPAVYKAIKPLDKTTTRSSWCWARGTTARRSKPPTRSARSASAPTPAHGSARMCCARSSRTI